MIVADTSVVIDGLRDKTGQYWSALRARFPGADWAVALPTRLEILMGARNDEHWRSLERHLSGWRQLEFRADDWTAAARIYAELRQVGVTLGEMDCCIAQAALSGDALLLHNDRDFERVAKIRPALRLEKIPRPEQ